MSSKEETEQQPTSPGPAKTSASTPTTTPPAPNACTNQQSVIQYEEPDDLDDAPVLPDLLDPYKFALEHVSITPDRVPKKLGMFTKRLAPGVVRIWAIEVGSIAELYEIEVGWYLLSCNGRQAVGHPDDVKANKDGIRMSFARKRSADLNPKAPKRFLGLYGAKLACEYAIVRLNMTKLTTEMVNLVTNVDGQVCVGNSADENALKEFGLRVGDAMLRVDGTVVREKSHCESLLRSGHDWVDVVVERPRALLGEVHEPNVVVPELSLSSPDEFAPPPDDEDGIEPPSPVWRETKEAADPRPVRVPSDPACGVPDQVPSDIVQIVSSAPSLARKIVSQKRRVAKMKLKKAMLGQVKLSKKVESTKLSRSTSDDEDEQWNF